MDAKSWNLLHPWVLVVISVLSVCSLSYLAFVGLDVLGLGARVWWKDCRPEGTTNPVGLVALGVVITSVLQSPSIATSTMVALVASRTLSLRQGIYAIMGTNLMGDRSHSVMGGLALLGLLPLEAATGFLFHITSAILGETQHSGGPLHPIISPATNRLIVVNQNIPNDGYDVCEDLYPIVCPNAPNCERVGLIACTDTRCPAFFELRASLLDDRVSGLACLVVGLAVVCLCTYAITSIMVRVLHDRVTPLLQTAATSGHWVMAVLAGFTLSVLSQSPRFVQRQANGLRMPSERKLAMSLGTNFGTGVTAFLVSFVLGAPGVAFAHLLYHATGLLALYCPVLVRHKILSWQKTKQQRDEENGQGPIDGDYFSWWMSQAWNAVVWVIFPVFLWVLSSLLLSDARVSRLLGALLLIVSVVVGIAVSVWWRWRGGREDCLGRWNRHQRNQKAIRRLHSDIEDMKEQLMSLRQFTGIEEDDDDQDEEEIEANEETKLDA